MARLTRRDLLAVGASAGLLPFAKAEFQTNRRRVIRIAHVTDIHVQPEKGGGEGMAQCLDAVNNLADKPDVVVFGGDQIMDAWGAQKGRVQTQWDLFSRVLADHNSLPVMHCFGNHDFWNGAGGAGENDPMYGQRWGMELAGLDKPYHARTVKGVKIICLDSTMKQGGGYIGKLSDEQFEWLESELASTREKMPVVIVSHIPIITVCGYFDGERVNGNNWGIPGGWMHVDAMRLKNLFKKHPNVKVALSGHMHQVDRADFLDVAYICSGAVCGGWWGEDYYEFGPGYAIVDLYDDGTVQESYEAYGWNYRP